jgi:hypothetical protein
LTPCDAKLRAGLVSAASAAIGRLMAAAIPAPPIRIFAAHRVDLRD